MVLLKLQCPPERRKAVIALTSSTSSPTCQIHPPAAAQAQPNFQIILTLRIERSTQPDRAITICTHGTVFAESDGQGLDMLAVGTFGPLTSTSDPSKTINLGQWKPHHLQHGREPQSPNLRERDGLEFLTIPANGQVEVRHDMSIDRMFEHESDRRREDLKPGETYRFRVSSGYLGTKWWCWGDLEGELKDKKLSAWQEGINFGKAEKPSPEQIEEEGWVLGANPAELAFEDKTGDIKFEFVD
ncbi:MAG: hypothetical protein Q9216_004851 [Gyalolechia sp. 2 TL-2023]